MRNAIPEVLEGHHLEIVDALMEGNLNPIAEMLRGTEPIPLKIRSMLAELLSPGTPPLYDQRLKLHQVKQKNTAIYFNIASEYARRRAKGETSESASANIGEQYGIDARTVMRHVRSWRQYASRLGEEEHGDN